MRLPVRAGVSQRSRRMVGNLDRCNIGEERRMHLYWTMWYGYGIMIEKYEPLCVIDFQL